MKTETQSLLKSIILAILEVGGLISVSFLIAGCLMFALIAGFDLFGRLYADYSDANAHVIMPYIEHVDKEIAHIYPALFIFLFALILALVLFVDFARARHA